MEKEKFKKLMEKYTAGLSTLDEEELLINNATTDDRDESQWFHYVKQIKKKPKANLNISIWGGIQKKEKRNQRRRLIITGMSVAASLLFLLFYFRPEPSPATKSLAEKQALLNEALSMFENNTIHTNNKKVLYEDEIIIIYALPE